MAREHRPQRPARPLLALLSGAVAAALGGCGAKTSAEGEARPAAETRETLGALELITHERLSAGPETVRSGWVRHQDWSLRWQGQPLQVQALTGLFADKPIATGRFHAVVVLEQPQGAPELLVLAGDANNTGSFHLITQDQGQVQTRLLCAVTGGDNALGRVQAGSGAQPQPTWLAGPQRLSLPAAAAGGAAAPGLLLGSRCLLDTARRSVRVLPQGLQGASLQAAQALALLSPDGQRLVRLARLDAAPGALALAVLTPGTPPADVVPGTVPAIRWEEQQALSQAPAVTLLPIDRQRQRTPCAEAIDAAWVLHHFEWRAMADGRWQLQARPGYRPLPHHGYYLPGDEEYRVEGLASTALLPLSEAAAQRLGTVLLPPQPDGYGGHTGRVLRLDGVDVALGRQGWALATSGAKTVDPAQRRAVLQRVVAAIEAELASGRYDAQFDFAAGRR